METFSALLALCAGNSPVPGDFPAQRPVTRSFDVFFDLRLNKRLNKQLWGWWVEMLSRRLWRHCNGYDVFLFVELNKLMSKQCKQSITGAWGLLNSHVTPRWWYIFLRCCLLTRQYWTRRQWFLRPLPETRKINDIINGQKGHLSLTKIS